MEPITQQEIRKTEEHLGQLKAAAFLKLQQRLKRLQPAIDDYLNSASEKLSENAYNRLLYTASVVRKVYADRHPQLRKVSADHLRVREQKNVHWTVLLKESGKHKNFFSTYPQVHLLEYILSRIREGLKPGEDARLLVRLKTVLDTLIDMVRLSPHHKPDPGLAYEVRVSLSNVEPEVWRTFQVPASCTLYKLHGVLQAVMGWNDRHLHLFRLGDLEFGTSDPGEDLDLLPDRVFRLDDLAHGHKLALEYVYDTGDNWLHLLEVKPVHLGTPLKIAPLLNGERATPPEDSGGPAGYRRLLEAMLDRSDFDPGFFDRAEAESRLRTIRFQGAPRPQPV